MRCFKYLHLGIIAPIKRKSLPEIAKVTGINSAQSLHHFMARSPWSVIEIRERRLAKTLLALKGKKITVIIDETGDRKKGKKTDYVARQYLGSIGKNAAGIDIGADSHWVSVPQSRDAQPVRRFGCLTSDLYALANWLKECQKECQVETVEGYKY